jgi:hypothetical protein
MSVTSAMARMFSLFYDLVAEYNKACYQPDRFKVLEASAGGEDAMVVLFDTVQNRMVNVTRQKMRRAIEFANEETR